jgi:5-(carboxyamino)imidazole ribonucleotide synthase
MNIGILGGGQLGWMTILEGRKLGARFFVLDDDPQSPASRVADRFFSPQEVKEFFQSCDLITWEFEHIDDFILEECEGKLLSSPEILKIKKSRVREKSFLQKRGFPVPPFLSCIGCELKEKVREIGFPVVVKSDSQGYDGKGQFLLRGEEELESFLKRSDGGSLWLVEKFVNFAMEVSLITVRDTKGSTLHYPLTRNIHREGILIQNSIFPEEGIIKRAMEINRALCEELSLKGLLAVEYFVDENGELLINEFAPRPHNTGHFSLDGCLTSQFENLVRVMMGIPMGSTRSVGWGGMVNIIGIDRDSLPLKEILSVEGAKVYWYGKEPRPRRKMGHVNLLCNDPAELEEGLKKVHDLLYAEQRVGSWER